MEGKQRDLRSLDEDLAKAEVWSDPERARVLQQRRSRILEGIESGQALGRLLDDARTLLELAREGEEVGEDLLAAVVALDAKAEEIELATLLTGEHDSGDAIVEIHPGA